MERVALYLRLSKEDFDKMDITSVSESIKNQELMLKEEVKKHDTWEIVGIYSDEDFSGAGTYRPGFEQLIKRCEKGEIDIVLCKSQSRFSRDMEIIEKYLHNRFMEWNIRFISLVDNADTKMLGNKKSRQINALVNEWFLEDLSNNIKATFRTKWKNGECTSAFAKYGFIKDPRNKNHLLIDPIARKTLRDMAHLFLEGYGQDKIAQILEERKIPSPYEYKAMNRCKLKIPSSKRISSIQKTGKYILKIKLHNPYPQTLKNVLVIFTLGTHPNQLNNSPFLLKVYSLEEHLTLYYRKPCSMKRLIDILPTTSNLESSQDWISLSNQEPLPPNVNYLAIQIDQFDRFLETTCELEVELPHNRQKLSYQLFHETTVNNEKRKIPLSYEIRKKCQWSGRMIYHMLKDESYHGVLVQGKTKRISYKNHKCVLNDKENWIRVENATEKIFDDITWEAIQNKMKEKNRVGKSGKNHLFCGKVYCDICGNIMHKNSSSTNQKKKIDYLVCKDRKEKWKNCDNLRSIRITKLEEIVRNSLQMIFKELYDEKMMKTIYTANRRRKEELSSLKELLLEKENIESIIQKKNSTFQELYNDKIEGILDISDFLMLHKNYKEEIEKCQNRLNVLEKEIREFHSKSKLDLDNFNFQKTILQLLDFQLINKFILRIQIGKIDNCHNRKVKIFWDF